MEEDLREAACMGNVLVVQKLLRSGVSINSQNSMNGWYVELHSLYCDKTGVSSVKIKILFNFIHIIFVY